MGRNRNTAAKAAGTSALDPVGGADGQRFRVRAIELDAGKTNQKLKPETAERKQMNQDSMLPIPRTTLTEMASAYRQSEADIRAAYAQLVTAEQRLRAAFQSESYTFALSRDRCDYTNADSTMDELKKAAWRALINKMGVKQAMSIKRANELEEQLSGKTTGCHSSCDKPKPLPEITEANILAMMEATFNSLPQMIEESVKEVFDWLRPSHWRLEYKTNQKSEWELMEKLILTGTVERGYSHQSPFRINYHRDQNMRALDNVFMMLDGRGIIKTHNGPLSDAIAASNGQGQTDYFEFKCFGNGNLHLKFRRMDLVSKLNAVAGGMRLKDAQHQEQAA